MLISFEEACRMINAGKLLHIAGDDSLLSKLPKGSWTGGTTPYFISGNGGCITKTMLYVNEIGPVSDYKISIYNADNICDAVHDVYSDGVSLMVIPFGCEAAAEYARRAPELDDLFLKPVVGWIAGYDLDTDDTAKVYDGSSGKSYEDCGVVMHLKLNENRYAWLGIVNIFEASDKEAITFPENTLLVNKCFVDGYETTLYDYLEENNIDTQLPLVANYNGVYINVSIKSKDDATKRVELYAPVFKGETYRVARPVADYEKAFAEKLVENDNTHTVFSCNCILNYQYGGLEGKKTPPFEGPVTFGEIAYQLLNQTLVYVMIDDK